MTDFRYEESLESFQIKRHDLLNLLINVGPPATDIHRRRWRVQKLDNALYDIKETVAAVNLQLDEEKGKLEEMNNESDRLRAVNMKLTEDVKILEGVTGMRAQIADEIDDPNFDQIAIMSSEFRETFADFYNSLPAIKQEIPIDPKISRNSEVLLDTLEECVSTSFDVRAEDASLSKESNEKTNKIRELEKQVRAKELKMKNEIDNQRKKVEESTRRMLKAIEEQGLELRKEAKLIEDQHMKEHDSLVKQVDSLSKQENNLLVITQNLQTYNKSLKESMRRRKLELELDLDRLVKRINTIKMNPNTVDKRLVNMSLLLSRKSALLDQAIHQMRDELASFEMWLKNK